MLHSRVVRGLVLLGASIVVPGYTAVNGSSVGNGRIWRQGSDGSPMPIPKPTGEVFQADGSPMPIPKPTGSTAQAA